MWCWSGKITAGKLFLYRYSCVRYPDFGSVCRSSHHRTRFSRCQRGVGHRPTTSPQHLDESGRIQFESMDAYVGRTVRLESESQRTLRSQRLALGRSRAASFSRQSSQGPTSTDHAKRIFSFEDHLVAASEIHRLGSTPDGVGRLKHSRHETLSLISEKTTEGRFLRKCSKDHAADAMRRIREAP